MLINCIQLPTFLLLALLIYHLMHWGEGRQSDG